MDRFSSTVQNENGRAVAGASIQITDQTTGFLAAIYASRDGAPLSNPFSTDDLGRWSFCAADGIYKARVFLGGVLKAELPDIRLEDPSDGSAPYRAPTGATLIGTATGTVQGDISDLQQKVASFKNYSLPAATATTLGGVKIGTGLNVDVNGVVSLSYSYTLPTASASVLGGIKVGQGLAMAPDGTLSATGLTQGSVASVNGITASSGGNVVLNTDNLPEAATPTNQWFTAARVRNVVLTGLSLLTNSAIVAADTVIVAFGKLQAQISSNTSSIATIAAAKDAADGYPGLTGFAVNVKNAAGTIASKIASAATAARTWTFPDKDGTVAMLSDIPVGGSMVLLAQQTVSSAQANIDFLNVFTSAYDKYVIELSNYQPSAAQNLAFQVALGGTVSNLNVYSAPQGNGNSTSTFTTSTLIGIGVHNTAQTSHGLTFEINNANANVPKAIGVRGIFTNNTGAVESVMGTAHCGAANVLSGFRLFWAGGGNFTKATVRVYGIKNT